MTTGQRIKKRRKELGLSADCIAEKLGVSRSTVFRYESGSIEKLPADILEPLSSILYTTPEYLMGWSDEEEFGINLDGNSAQKTLFHANLYRNIEKLCNEKGIDVTTMCREAGVSSGSLSDLKTNRISSLSLKTINKIADYFQISVDEIQGKNSPVKENKKTAKQDEKIILLARHLEEIPESDRKQLINTFQNTIDLYLKAKGIKTKESDET